VPAKGTLKGTRGLAGDNLDALEQRLCQASERKSQDRATESQQSLAAAKTDLPCPTQFAIVAPVWANHAEKVFWTKDPYEPSLRPDKRIAFHSIRTVPALSTSRLL